MRTRKLQNVQDMINNLKTNFKETPTKFFNAATQNKTRFLWQPKNIVVKYKEKQ